MSSQYLTYPCGFIELHVSFCSKVNVETTSDLSNRVTY